MRITVILLLVLTGYFGFSQTRDRSDGMILVAAILTNGCK